MEIHKAAGILIKDRKLLVGRSRGKTVFTSPGGKLEPGETHKQALVRELIEEFSITTTEKDFEEFGEFTAQATGQEDRTLTMQTFIVKEWGGDPVPSSEVEELMWITSRIPQNIQIGSIFEHQVLPRLKKLNLID